MRLSTHHLDASYPEWKRLHEAGKKMTAYLDGEKVEHCSTADEELGYVECAVPDREHGKPFCIDDTKGQTDQIAVQIRYGAVTIEIQ